MRIVVAAGMAWLVVACLDVSSPVFGISSISPILLPTPSIIVGDSLRDTAGNVRPVSVTVYGPNGDTITGAGIQFVAVDSTNRLRVNSATGFAAGFDSASPLAKVVATVSSPKNGGFLQTPQMALPVVFAPTAAQQDTDFTFQPALPSIDTLSSRLISQGFGVTVRSANGHPVPSYPVIFMITRMPPPLANTPGPTVVLTNSAGIDTTVAVTDNSGHAQIHLRLRPADIQPTLVLTPDTVVVKWQVRVRGTPIPVTPPDSFVIQVKPTIPQP